MPDLKREQLLGYPQPLVGNERHHGRGVWVLVPGGWIGLQPDGLDGRSRRGRVVAGRLGRRWHLACRSPPAQHTKGCVGRDSIEPGAQARASLEMLKAAPRRHQGLFGACPRRPERSPASGSSGPAVLAGTARPAARTRPGLLSGLATAPSLPLLRESRGDGLKRSHADVDATPYRNSSASDEFRTRSASAQSQSHQGDQMADFTIKRTDDIETIFDGIVHRARASIGATSVGIQVMHFRPAGRATQPQPPQRLGRRERHRPRGDLLRARRLGVGPERVVQLGESSCGRLAAEGAVVAFEVVAPEEAGERGCAL